MADIYGTNGNDILTGTTDNDTIYGFVGSDYLLGGDGYDTLMGGTGNDTLNGDLGNDVLNGGVGNDLLQDFSGSDIYIFGVGSGQDTVQDFGVFGEIDTVQLINGVTPTNLLITQDFSVNFGAVTLRLAQSDDQLIIQNFNSIEQLQFADGTVWDQSMIQSHLLLGQTGTAGQDFLGGTVQSDYLQGLAGDDMLVGGEGNDALMGGSGRDTLWGDAGNDVLNGGAGNDSIQDFSGNDTYVFGAGSGQDIVQDWGSVDEIDTVQLTSDVTPATLLITQDWVTNQGGLTLRLAQSDDQLIIQNVNSMEQIQFADGTVWDAATIQARLQQGQTGTVGNDVLSGFGINNYLRGEAGDDTLYGNSGMDALIGGSGNDQLQGGLGNDVLNGGAGNDVLQDIGGSDTYVWGLGSGIDTVQDQGLISEMDTLQLMDGVNEANLAILLDTSNLTALFVRLDGTADQLTIQGTNSIEQFQFSDGVVWDAAITQAHIQLVHLQSTEESDNLSGSTISDQLFGLGGNDVMDGKGGNDFLDGGAGIDIMIGGVGDDIFIIDNLDDIAIENFNEGMDTVQSSVTYALSANVENLILSGGESINGTGNDLNNTLIGNSGANVLDGGLGADTMIG